jgi:hypothetical protein
MPVQKSACREDLLNAEPHTTEHPRCESWRTVQSPAADFDVGSPTAAWGYIGESRAESCLPELR